MAGPAPATLANHEDRSAGPVHCSAWLYLPPGGHIFEQPDDLASARVLALTGAIKRVHPHPAADGRIGTDVDQQLRHFVRTLASVVAQRRVPDRALVVSVDVRPGLDEASDHLKTVILNRVMQGRLPEVVEAVEGIVALDQIVDARKIAILRRSVQLLALKLCDEVTDHRQV